MEKTSLKFVVFSVGLMLFIFGCEKDNDKNNANEVQPSERQLHSFSQGKVGFYNNSPTLVNDYVYIGTSRGTKHDMANDNAFYKLDKDLNKVWEYPLGNIEVKGAATLDNMGNIYFVTGEGRNPDSTHPVTLKLYSLDNDGHFRWSKVILIYTPHPWYNDDLGGISNPAVSVENVIYVGGDKFYAFDNKGSEMWSYTPPGNYDPMINPIMTSPIIDPAGNIYFNANGILISLDKNGVKRWITIRSFSISTISSPAFSVDYTKVYIAAGHGIVCIKTSDGSMEWKLAMPDMFDINGFSRQIRAIPAVDDNNNIYIGTHGSNSDDDKQTLYAIKSDGSGILWQNVIGSDLYCSPALGNDRVLYIGSEDYMSRNGKKRLHAIDMTTGKTIWTAQLQMDVTWSSPAISNNGTLYIASMDGYPDLTGMVYAFRTNSTGLLPNAGSPRFHEGNASTGRRE